MEFHLNLRKVLMSIELHLLMSGRFLTMYEGMSKQAINR